LENLTGVTEGHGQREFGALGRAAARSDGSQVPGQVPPVQAEGQVLSAGLHGGKGGSPKGERNGAYRTGRYTAEAKAERRAARVLLQQLLRLIDAGE
jgi:hypothetical protein